MSSGAMFLLFLVVSFLCQEAGVSAQEASADRRSAPESVPVAEPRPVQDLKGVLSVTYVNNPALRAARSELKATREKLSQALSGWQPTISADGHVTYSDVDGSNFGGGGNTTAKGMSLSLNQPLFSGGRTLAQTKAAKYTIQAQAAFLAAKEQDILLEAVTAYMDVLKDAALLDLSENNKDVIARQLEATQDRFEVGELTKTDVAQAEARLARAESNTIGARGDLNASKARFASVTGLEPWTLEQPLVVLPIPETLEEATSVADQSNPAILFALNAHRAAEEDIDNVFGELLPNLDLFSSWSKTWDPSPGLIDKQVSQEVGVSASIPLYSGGAVRSRVRQAQHIANQKFIEVADARRQTREAVVSGWEKLQAARGEIRSRQAQVKASKVAQEGVHAEAELGSRTVLDSLDSDQELLDAQVALVTAQRNETVAEFSFLSKLGGLTARTLLLE